MSNPSKQRGTRWETAVVGYLREHGDCDEAPEHIAARLGYPSAKTLARVLEKWGEPSLARRLTRTEAAA